MIAVVAGLLLSATTLSADRPDPAAACSPGALARTADMDPGQFRRLEDLPPGVLQRAVLRTIAGCSVIEARVDGQTVYIPSPPRAQRLAPVGQRDTAPQVRPEGAPSHR